MTRDLEMLRVALAGRALGTSALLSLALDVLMLLLIGGAIASVQPRSPVPREEVRTDPRASARAECREQFDADTRRMAGDTTARLLTRDRVVDECVRLGLHPTALAGNQAAITARRDCEARYDAQTESIATAMTANAPRPRSGERGANVTEFRASRTGGRPLAIRLCVEHAIREAAAQRP
jgi:hypothetical protein